MVSKIFFYFYLKHFYQKQKVSKISTDVLWEFFPSVIILSYSFILVSLIKKCISYQHCSTQHEQRNTETNGTVFDEAENKTIAQNGIKFEKVFVSSTFSCFCIQYTCKMYLDLGKRKNEMRLRIGSLKNIRRCERKHMFPIGVVAFIVILFTCYSFLESLCTRSLLRTSLGSMLLVQISNKFVYFVCSFSAKLKRVICRHES